MHVFVDSGGADYSLQAQEVQQLFVEDALEDMTATVMTTAPPAPASLLDDSGNSDDWRFSSALQLCSPV